MKNPAIDLVRTYARGVRAYTDRIRAYIDPVLTYIDVVRTYIAVNNGAIGKARTYIRGVGTDIRGVRTYIGSVRTFIDHVRKPIGPVRTYMAGGVARGRRSTSIRSAYAVAVWSRTVWTTRFLNGGRSPAPPQGVTSTTHSGLLGTLSQCPGSQPVPDS